MKATVLHINDSFFKRTETFIYNYISNGKNFRFVCLAEKFINLDQFPFPEENMERITFNNKYVINSFLFNILKRNRRIETVLKDGNLGLIHAHFGPSGVYALSLKREFSIPLITSFYGYDISELPKISKWRKKFKILFDEGDLFLVEGNYMKSKLIDLGCSENKIQIQRIAIPLGRISFTPRRQKNPGEKIIFIFSGRFVEKKGAIYALRAINKVRNNFSNFEFRIIGDGPLKPEIERFIKDHNIGCFVKMLGFLTYENYLKEMDKADIFIHPSITADNGDSEGGAPTTILEAQAIGLPIISTYHADIPNIVKPNESALLSKERDWEELASNMENLIKNQERWREMGRIGREFVQEYHNIDKEIFSLEEKYRFILRRNVKT